MTETDHEDLSGVSAATAPGTFVGAVADLLVLLAAGGEVDGLVALAAERTRTVFAVDAVEVLVEHGSGPQWSRAQTSDDLTALHLLQLRDDGPCVEALRTGEAIAVPWVAGVGRWARWAEAAGRAGYRSVLVVPLLRGTRAVGLLGLSSTGPRPRAFADRRDVAVFGELLVLVVDVATGRDDDRARAAQLSDALSARTVVEQAVGVLAEREGVSAEEARAWIRRHARDHDEPLAAVAGRLVRDAVRPGRRQP